MAPQKQPEKQCPYGKRCYRKNPIHFSEFAHKNLDAIYAEGRSSLTNEYNIPTDLDAEIIKIQLTLLEKLFPAARKAEPNSKKANTKDNSKDSAAPIDDSKKKENFVRASNKTLASPQTSTSHRNATSVHVAAKNDARKINELESSPQASTSRSAAAARDACQTDGAAMSSSTSHVAKKPKVMPNIRDYIPVIMEKGRMAKKLEQAAPYNMFLTAVTDCKATHNEPLSVTMQEILDKSLGEIECSVQINFMIEIGWLLGHYYFAGIMGTPLLVLYGADMPELEKISQQQPAVTAIKVKMPTAFSTAHAKVMLLGYKDGSMRVVISTANLYEDDWHNRTQGVWISPTLQPLPEDADTAAGESPTNFKQDLMLYLIEYKIAKLQPWIARIRGTDFGAINVFFIGSVPGGSHEGARGYPWGHPRVSGLLKKHATHIDDKIPVVCQSSSIGSLGPNVQTWIQQDIINSFRQDSTTSGLRQLPNFKMIYPSFSNVRNSHDNLLGGACLPYGKSVNDKQPWLKTYLHQWSAKMRNRSKAVPHIKSYTRFSVEERCVYWFMLTSANLSKAAWGAFNRNSKLQPSLRIYNYEAGVLFLPRFVIGEETFPLASARDGIPAFPMPYDVPLTPYGPDDTPFLQDCIH